MRSLEKLIVIFDIEFWSDEGVAARRWASRNEHSDIIQCGAVLFNTKTLKNVKIFKCLVKLETHQNLSEYIIDLTGITQKEIDEEGIHFRSFLSEFQKFCGDYEIYCFDSNIDRSRVFDLDILMRNCKTHEIKFPFENSRFHNINRIFHENGFEVKQSGEIPLAFGLEIAYRPHDALNDVIGIIIGLKELKRILGGI